MGKLINIARIDQFYESGHLPREAISHDVLVGVRELHEITDLESMLRSIVGDPSETPHGPTEIADILTTHVHIDGQPRVAAFVLKGRSFPKVRSKDIAHQVIRLRTIPTIGVLILVAVGDIQDDAKRDFLQVVADAQCDYLIMDAVDCARLLITYGKICPLDGTPYGSDHLCHKGHRHTSDLRIELRVRDGLRYEIVELRDMSHRGARRLSAKVVVDPHYTRELLRVIVKKLVEDIRRSQYHRNSSLSDHFGAQEAQVVWLYIGGSNQDVRHANWIVRAEWIDPTLEPSAAPTPMDFQESFNGISLQWNRHYLSRRDIYTQQTVDKGTALAGLEPLIAKAIKIGQQLTHWFDNLDAGVLVESEFVERLQSVATDIQQLEDTAAKLPFPPRDVQDYDERAHSLIAHLGNMAINYSPWGLEIRSEPNRRAVMRAWIEDFQSDLHRLQFEREKLH